MGDAPLTTVSWALGRRFLRYRKASGLSAEKLAKAMKVSQPTVTRIEKGKHRLTDRQLADICKALSVGPDDAAELKAARDLSLQPDWRQDYARIIDGPLGDVLGLEGGARRLRMHQPSFVPGLLQTEEYAYAVLREMPNTPESQVRRRVEMRMRRQEGVQSGTQHLVACINWAVLRQQVGGPKVMLGMVRKLIDSLDANNITIRVVPPGAGVHAGYGSSYRIMEFDEEIDLPTVVATETLTSSLVYETEDRVEVYVESFDQTLRAALDHDATAAYLAAAEADYREG